MWGFKAKSLAARWIILISVEGLFVSLLLQGGKISTLSPAVFINPKGLSRGLFSLANRLKNLRKFYSENLFRLVSLCGLIYRFGGTCSLSAFEGKACSANFSLKF
jgi:hypothetical protein